MKQLIRLNPEALTQLRTVDERLMSYNVEMTEVTGGTFWKPYTSEQIAGTESFPPVTDFAQMYDWVKWYDPIDLYNEKLRGLAKAFGPTWIRISGSWATKTYYDFDDHTDGKAPEGYQNVLTKEQWIGVLDFVKAIGAKLLVSVSNCEGLHAANEPWNSSQAELLFELSREYGVPIDAAEFMNEPNMLEGSGAPKGYTPADFARDQDLFNGWVRENYPECLIVGPCTTDSGAVAMGPGEKGGSGIAEVLYSCSTDELMQGCQVKLDVFSYHYYNGVSERLASLMPSAHWSPDDAASESYLSMASRCTHAYAPFRDKYCPGGPIWVTESGDAGGGGDTWASTYLDVLRTLNELGSFATITDGVIFHNTLASSDYGFLQHGTFDPRPNYWAVLLWTKLMGTTVYNSQIPIQEGAHIYAHNRKDGKEGMVYLVINNSLTESTSIELPKDAERYTLDGNGNMRSTVAYLNGNALKLGENSELPKILPVKQAAGGVTLAPGSCTFFVL